MAEMIPKVCGKPAIHVPDDDCPECIRQLNQFKGEVHDEFDRVDDELATKLTKDNIKAGNGISISTSGNDVTINSTGTYTAGQGISISGNVISVNLTKANLLSILGYEETTLTITDLDNVEVTKTVLVKR